MSPSRKFLFTFTALLVCVLAVSGCAPANDVTVHSGAGFWNGLWDGITCGVAFLCNLFGAHYGVYDVHNNGNWYDFGFVLGAGTFLTGLIGGRSATRR